MVFTPSSGPLQEREPAPVLQVHEREAQIALFRAKAEEITAIASAMNLFHSRQMPLGLGRTYDQMANTMSRIRRPDDR